MRQGNHFRAGSCHFGSERVSCFEKICVPVALRWNWGATEVVDRSVVSAALVGREESLSAVSPLDVRKRVYFVSVCCKLVKVLSLSLAWRWQEHNAWYNSVFCAVILTHRTFGCLLGFHTVYSQAYGVVMPYIILLFSEIVQLLINAISWDVGGAIHILGPFFLWDFHIFSIFSWKEIFKLII